MNLSEQIRAWLKTQDGPRSSTAMANGTGHDRLKVQFAVGVMLRDGVMKRVQAKRPCTYEIAREVLSKAEVLKMAHEGRSRKGREISKETEERKRQEAKARRNERDRNKRAAKAKPTRSQATVARMVCKARIVPEKLVQAKEPPSPKVQSVADFLASGGRVEVLPATWDART